MNGFISFCVSIALLICFLYAGYALWDNQQLYVAAESVYEEMNQIRQSYKLDDLQAEDLSSQFQELQAINPDVTGWVTVFGTEIDHPLVQGSNNLTYINKNVYGEFDLAGSVYLDTRNDRDYSNTYNLVYGHNMSRHRMLSDINLYKDEDFFKQNQIGILLLPDRACLLKAISFFLTTEGNSTLFNPDNWLNSTNEQIMQYVQQDAMYISETGLEALKNKLENGEQPHLLALSTCSSESDEARTILLMLIDP